MHDMQWFFIDLLIIIVRHHHNSEALLNFILVYIKKFESFKLNIHSKINIRINITKFLAWMIASSNFQILLYLYANII